MTSTHEFFVRKKLLGRDQEQRATRMIDGDDASMQSFVYQGLSKILRASSRRYVLWILRTVSRYN